MSLTKRYLKTRPVCKVTFRVPRKAAGEARAISVVGEFNDWKPQKAPMRRLRDGSFSLTLELPTGRAYQFRYLDETGRWSNDWEADGYVQADVAGSDNSVVRV